MARTGVGEVVVSGGQHWSWGDLGGGGDGGCPLLSQQILLDVIPDLGCSVRVVHEGFSLIPKEGAEISCRDGQGEY